MDPNTLVEECGTSEPTNRVEEGSDLSSPFLTDDESEEEEDYSLDLQDLIAKANSTDHPSTSSCCIYKVPRKLRTINEQAYTPTLISIGPFHRRDPRLWPMQNTKFRFLNEFLKRNPEKSVYDYVQAISSWDEEIRQCYSEKIVMDGNNLAYMTLIDAGFIIGFFMANTMEQPQHPLVAKPWITSNLMLDLILLENQLPFFVLERLFKLSSPGATDDVSFRPIAFKNFVSSFLKNMCPENHEIFRWFSLENSEENHLIQYPKVEHLCDVLRTFYLSSGFGTRKRGVDTGMKRSYGASRLQDAGIEFQVDDQAHSMIKVSCSDQRRLDMPSIKINDWTEIMLRNVVAFEQCHHPFTHYVTDYVFLLDCLINTEKDVEILIDKGIIQNMGDYDKVAAMVNKLCDKVTTRNISLRYLHVYEKLNEFYNDPYYRNKATFMREYWSTPWKRLSLLAGTLLLFLTLIQAVCSVIPLFNK